MSGLKRKLSIREVEQVAKRVRSSVSKRRRSRGNPGGAILQKGVFTIGNAMAVETKNQDTTVALVNVHTAAPLVQDLLAAIAEGDGNGNRDGQRILVKSIDAIINFNGKQGATAVTYPTPVFASWFIVLDKQTNGTAPAAADIFSTNASNLTYGYSPNLERFQVLRRGDISFDPASHHSEIVKFHVPLSIQTRFADGTGAPQTNGLYFVCLSTGPASASTLYSMELAARFRVKFQG